MKLLFLISGGVLGLSPSDTKFMRLALDEAREAGARQEVPIGAVLVDERINEVIARGRNRVEELLDASAHAELMCMRSGAQKVENWRLLNLTLFSTVEPCPMCLSAAYAFRIHRIVYGAPDLRLGAVGSWIRLPEIKHPFHDIMIEGGLLEDESAQLLRDFFRRRRGRTTTNALKAKIIEPLSAKEHDHDGTFDNTTLSA